MTNNFFVGDKLRLARLFHGLSQAELGERVSASRQFIHQIETEEKQPSDQMVVFLSDALLVEPDFFVTKFGGAVTEEQCHFRKLRTTPAAVARQVAARGTFFDQLVAVIERWVALPRRNFPQLDVTTAGDIEKAAENCRIHWGLGSGPIKNMTRVVESAGAIVTHFDGVSEKVDALSVGRPRPIIVRNDAKSSAVRLRFDIAHECGHLVMHSGVETGDVYTEDQAHRFASAFLLPRALFLTEFPRSYRLDWEAIFQLKLRTGVSVKAIVRRAYDLSLIDSLSYRRAHIHLSKTGQTKAEKFDDVIELEKPEVLVSALKVLNGMGVYRRDLAKAIFVKEELVSQIIGIDMGAGEPGAGNNVVPFPGARRGHV